VKQHLAAIRMLFGWLVVGQVLAVNPASFVRGPKYSVKKGKTAVLSAAEARTLLDFIESASHVARRDRALIALMVYTFARVGAALKMRVEMFTSQSTGPGCDCTGKAASGTRCAAITISTLTSTLISSGLRSWATPRFFYFLLPLDARASFRIVRWDSGTLIA